MNNNKVSFIICKNKDLVYDECVRYINALDFPDGITYDIIPIEGAEYITQAYNKAMNSSDAKYKVYLHQDIHILNKDFIYDILDIFSDDKIGLIGIAGSKKITGFLETACWDSGNFYENCNSKMVSQNLDKSSNRLIEVQAVDGILMATQYDIPWREDILKGWHFYDISQSLEYQKNGYKIVVPNYHDNWVLHDNGKVDWNAYLFWKKIFLDNYREFINSIAGISDDNTLTEKKCINNSDDEVDASNKRGNNMRICIIGTDLISMYLVEVIETYSIEIVRFFADYIDSETSIQINDHSYKIDNISKCGIYSENCECYVICSNDFEKYYNELISQTVNPSSIISQKNFIDAVIIGILKQKYKNSSDYEINECMKYITTRMKTEVFNYSFTDRYNRNDAQVFLDENCGLFYVIFNGKKMYFNRNYKDEQSVRGYLNGIMLEQDIDSPHYYDEKKISLKKGDIVIDAGVAEGNFALSVIDDVSKIYLVECDPAWNEALVHTFEPYKEKVVFVKKFLSDHSDSENISIDDFIPADESVDVIKMDIEGAEISSLIGAQNTIRRSENIRIVACSYHNHNDEILIKSLMNYYGLETTNSKGYMLFLWDKAFYKNPEFRRGLVFGVKKGEKNGFNNK